MVFLFWWGISLICVDEISIILEVGTFLVPEKRDHKSPGGLPRQVTY